MADVYGRISGMKLEKFIAVEPGVHGALEDAALEVGARAEAILAEHHHDGDAEILVEELNEVDMAVVLSDERGQLAALSIEFGRDPYETKDGKQVGGMEGLFILHQAAKLKKRGRK